MLTPDTKIAFLTDHDLVSRKFLDLLEDADAERANLQVFHLPKQEEFISFKGGGIKVQHLGELIPENFDVVVNHCTPDFEDEFDLSAIPKSVKFIDCFNQFLPIADTNVIYAPSSLAIVLANLINSLNNPKDISVVTIESASIYGKKGLDSLFRELKASNMMQPRGVYASTLALNTIAGIGITADESDLMENKTLYELEKMLRIPSKIALTRVYSCSSVGIVAVVNFTLPSKQKFSQKELTEVSYIDGMICKTMCVNEESVFAGRMRKFKGSSTECRYAINLAFDNILKSAEYIIDLIKM